MSRAAAQTSGMTLYSGAGEAKYLNADERARFYAALDDVEDPEHRTFLEMIFWTGMRPSEALSLTLHSIDVWGGFVSVCCLKKRKKKKGKVFRHIPLQRGYLERLDRVHGIRIAQAAKDNRAARRLWRFGRTTGWKLMKAAMTAAGVFGIKACARGLRHSFGVVSILSGIAESRVMLWLGHSDIQTTQIYLDLVAPEDRAMMQRLWDAQPAAPTDIEPAPHPRADTLPVIVGGNEVQRIVNAYCAIEDQDLRLGFLSAIETCNQTHGPH